MEAHRRLLGRALLVAVAAAACGPGKASEPADETTDDGASGEPTTASSSSTASAETTAPADSTTTATTGPSVDDTTGPVMGCGNGIVELGEQCDGDDLADATCLNLFGYPGDVTCTPECTFEVIGCVPPGMIYIPAGEFEMGSDAFFDDERPARQVQLDAFYIDANAVTKDDYSACVSAGDCLVPTPGIDCNWEIAGRLDHPINCVTWDDANAYCEWAGGVIEKRLPTEAEWEKAARGDDARLWPWGGAPLPACTHVVMNEGLGGGCGVYHSLPVGSRPKGDSPYGVHDMAGGIWNWVADWYSVYDVGVTENPTGPQNGTYRIIRGGGWDTEDINWFRTSARNPQATTMGNRNIGFRCAQAPPTPPPPP
jgi:formylglycine-generating enzyme required for sulfatase activity